MTSSSPAKSFDTNHLSEFSRFFGTTQENKEKKQKKPTKNNACVTIEEKVYYKNEYTLK